MDLIRDSKEMVEHPLAVGPVSEGRNMRKPKTAAATTIAVAAALALLSSLPT